VRLAAVAFAVGAAGVVFTLAEQGALPRVVGPGQVADAVAATEARSAIATLAGPPLGGALFAVNRLLPFAVDAASFALVAIAALLVRTPLQDRGRPPRASLVADVAEGIRWLWDRPFLRDSALAVAAGNFTWAAVELVLIVRVRESGATPAATGGMVALIGAGSLAGALIAPRLRRAVSGPWIVLGTFWLQAALFAPMALVRDPFALGALAGLAALPAPGWNAVIVGARLTLTPDRLRARATSAARLVSGALLPLGALAAGALASAAGTGAALAGLAALQALVAAAASATPSLRVSPR
jgi:Transmembrane secretion effector